MAFTAGAKLAIVLVSVGALCLVVSGLMSLEHAHGLPVTTWITKQAKIVWEWLRDDLYCVFVEFLGELTILVACWVVAGVSGSFSPDRSMGPLAFIPPICLSVSVIRTLHCPYMNLVLIVTLPDHLLPCPILASPPGQDKHLPHRRNIQESSRLQNLLHIPVLWSGFVGVFVFDVCFYMHR
jgi:hypothetical protein